MKETNLIIWNDIPTMQGGFHLNSESISKMKDLGMKTYILGMYNL